jgi:HEAT repeat protein
MLRSWFSFQRSLYAIAAIVLLPFTACGPAQDGQQTQDGKQTKGGQQTEGGQQAKDDREVRYLAEQMLSENASKDERTYAAHKLGRMGPKARAAVPQLALAVKHVDLDLQDQALRALARMAPKVKEAQPILVDELKRTDYRRQLAVRAVASYGPAVVPDVVQLLPYLGASETLAELGPAAKDAVPALIKVVETHDPNIPLMRAVAARALGRIGPAAKDAVPALTAQLQQLKPPFTKDVYHYFRFEVAAALTRINPADAVALGHLKECRTLPRNTVYRIWASYEVARHDPADREAIQFLAGFLETAKDDLHWVVEQLGLLGPQAKETFPRLSQLAQDPPGDVLVRYKAFVALVRIDQKAAVPILLKLLNDQDDLLRMQVVQALGQVPHPANDVVAALRTRYDIERTTTVKEEVEDALAKLERSK